MPYGIGWAKRCRYAVPLSCSDEKEDGHHGCKDCEANHHPGANRFNEITGASAQFFA